MPGRNITRIFTEESYYHVYNRGLNKRKIFLDEEDYAYFCSLFQRYIDKQVSKDAKGRSYRWLGDDVQLIAYCLMPNHFHLLVYQLSDHGVTDLLLSLGTAYTMYFNKKYGRRGPLFENTYRASHVGTDEYLEHVSRYIHLNPKHYRSWPHSSFSAYTAIPGAAPGKSWLHPAIVLEQFENKQAYEKFVSDYKAMHAELDEIKHMLADH